MTENRNKDITPAAVVPTPLDQHPRSHFNAPILAPPGFPIPQATSDNYHYQSYINYSTACVLQQFYWNQLLASFVSHSTLAAMVPTEEAQVANLKMEDLKQFGGRDQSHHQSAPGAPAPAPLNLTIAVKSKIDMKTKTPPHSSVVVVTPVDIHASASNSNQPSEKSKDFICHQCNFRFGFKHVLKNHLRTHTGERPYECTICQQKFARSHHLTTHMRGHTGEKPYECSDCDAKFAQYSNLRRHLLKKHNDMEAGVSQEKKCGMCTKTFSDRMKLSRHVKK